MYREEALASRYADLEQTAWPVEPRLRLIGLGLVFGAISILCYLQSIPVSRYVYVPGALIRLSSSSDARSHGSASQLEKYILVIEVAPGSLKSIKPGASVSVQLSKGGASNNGKIKEIASGSSHVAESPHSKTYVHVELDSQQVVPRLPLHLGQMLLLRVALRRDPLRNVIMARTSAP